MNTRPVTPKILVAEDDITSGLVLEGMLQDEGFHTIRAMTGAECVALASKKKPDLVLMDVNMPDGDGFEACRKLKDDPRLADIPVIFVTSELEVDSKLAGFEAGGVDYVTKPYDPAEIMARIRLHLRLRQAQETLVKSYAERIMSLTTAQKSILPSPADVPDGRFSVVYKPLGEAGGDFYDVVNVGDGVCDYVVADIGGHDLGSSLATAGLKAVIHQDLSLLFTPTETVRMLNDVMRSVLAEEQYLTLVYIRLNRAKNIMTIVNAGHPPVILVDGKGNAKKLAMSGDLLGAFNPACLVSYDTRVAKGDRVFLFTDGMLETGSTEQGAKGRQLNKLVTLCSETRKVPIANTAKNIVEKILTDGGNVIHDDLLFLALEV